MRLVFALLQHLAAMLFVHLFTSNAKVSAVVLICALGALQAVSPLSSRGAKACTYNVFLCPEMSISAQMVVT